MNLVLKFLMFPVRVTSEAMMPEFPEDSFVLAHVGGFVKSKNHDFIIRVFYEIQAAYPNAFLLLIAINWLKYFVVISKVVITSLIVS